MDLRVADPHDPPVAALIAAHLADLHAVCSPAAVHALPVAALAAPAVTLWAAWIDDTLVGCGGLQELDHHHGEIKSMRTVPAARGRGVATALLDHLVQEARRRGYRRLSLETGTHACFAAARRLYVRAGFTPCGPFAAYRPNPESCYYTLAL